MLTTAKTAPVLPHIDDFRVPHAIRSASSPSGSFPIVQHARATSLDLDAGPSSGSRASRPRHRFHKSILALLSSSTHANVPTLASSTQILPSSLALPQQPLQSSLTSQQYHLARNAKRNANAHESVKGKRSANAKRQRAKMTKRSGAFPRRRSCLGWAISTSMRRWP